MTRSKLDNRILFFAIFSVIFFPMKGIISFLSFYLFQADISSFSGTLILFIISPLIIYSILIHTRLYKTFNTFFLIFFGIIGLLLSIFNKDILFFYYSSILFLMPALLSWTNKVDEIVINKLFELFLKLTIVFVSLETIFINFSLFGFISTDQLIEYQSSFTSSNLIAVFDMRHMEGLYRTGGYLGNILAMPVFILFSFVYMYAQNSYATNFNRLVWLILAFCALIMSGSATSIFSGIITILFYEIFVRKNLRNIFMLGIPLLTLGLLFIDHLTSISFIFMRFFENISNPEYLTKFINIDTSLINQIRMVLLGGLKSDLEGIPSHNDIIKILFMFGIIPTLFLVQRWYSILRFGLKSPIGSTQNLFSLVLLSLIITFLHHGMGLTIYPMLFGTIMLLQIEKKKTIFFVNKRF